MDKAGGVQKPSKDGSNTTRCLGRATRKETIVGAYAIRPRYLRGVFGAHSIDFQRAIERIAPFSRT